MKKIFKLTNQIIFLIFALFFCISTVSADNGYTIDAYDVNIIVKENNVLEITEKIDADFQTSKHGIIRKIPLRNTVTREDGTTSKNSVRISDIDVDNEFAQYNEDNYRVIKIGDPEKKITGTQQYTIKYKYNLGKDPLKDKDELYYNIIGPEWDTTIENITFTVSMPKEFDSAKLGFSSGAYGSTNSSKISAATNGNTIVGTYIGKLNAYEGITVRCELDEGYFVNAGIPLPKTAPLMFIIPLISLLISIYLWYKYGRDDEVIETVEFYAPNDLNSAEVAYIYKSSVSSNDVNSLLIYLANKGYLKISETKTESKKDKNNYKIIKLKEYDGNNKNEQVFMEGLFKTGNEVTQDDLYDKFYKTIEKIRFQIDNYKNKTLLFEDKAYKKRTIAIFLLIISLLITVSIPSLDYGSLVDLMGAIVAATVFVVIFSVIAFLKKFPIILKVILCFIFTILMKIICTDLAIGYAMSANIITMIAVIFGLVCAIGICTCIKYMAKRTNYGTEIYGRVKGFKNFLETAEKDRLEALVMDDPTYFYNILPYTYVFGLSDKWIKKFEDITLQEPDWYDSDTPFTVLHLNNFLNSTMASSSDYVVESSSSGGFSGGGFSGGGSGGGGGSSW